MAERVPNQRQTARPDEKLLLRKRRADPPEKCQWHDVTSLIKASDHGGAGWMLHSFAGRRSASIRPPFPAVAGQGLRGGRPQSSHSGNAGNGTDPFVRRADIRASMTPEHKEPHGDTSLLQCALHDLRLLDRHDGVLVPCMRSMSGSSAVT